ncbi:sensor histidine kinase [Lacibacterium aquatile]|uniref:histidine kinase n=1 Tax=Lacibacterium aquatile TaxID=1168082 RepID=A0ABW5DUC6_9PROT
MLPKRAFSKSLALIILLWLVLVAGFAGFSIRERLSEARSELEGTSRALHRLISQRVAQHDAHLTGLVALITAADPMPEGAIRQVSQSVLRFYPRVASMHLLRLGPSPTTILSEPEGPAPDLSVIAPVIAAQRQGQVRTYVTASATGRYLLGKRATYNDPGIAVVLQVDPARLIEVDELPPRLRLTLSFEDQVIFERAATGGEDAPFLAPLHFSQLIDGPSQPFRLDTHWQMSVQDVVSLRPLLIFAVVSALILLALWFAWQQQAKARQSEQRAGLLEHETRLAHASRVNAMGELASGIAHELTQPLTALLSQSQAALRLTSMPSSDPTLLAQALEANVREAKRAGLMLKRMRDYISNRQPTPVLADLNQIVLAIADLMRADLERQHISLTLDLAQPAPQSVVDPIEMEQVLHNLVRNAAHALLDGGTIRIATASEGRSAVIRVADSGPGIPPDVLPRLFEPFFTTKEDGMGLGLSLCETLLGRVGGQIEGHNDPAGGAVFTIQLEAAR